MKPILLLTTCMRSTCTPVEDAVGLSVRSLYLTKCYKNALKEGWCRVHGVGELGVQLRLDVVELRDESVLGPINDNLAHEEQGA